MPPPTLNSEEPLKWSLFTTFAFTLLSSYITFTSSSNLSRTSERNIHIRPTFKSPTFIACDTLTSNNGAT